jgi:hypothetical protein
MAQQRPASVTPLPVSRLLTAAHPRLLITDTDLRSLRSSLGKDSFTVSQSDAIRMQGDQYVKSHPYSYQLGNDGLLHVARNIESRIITLAGLYRLTGDKKYKDRAVSEMLSASSFKDWNPSHFLDTAEMTAALGIGYDWLYPSLTLDQRTTIRDALQHKGIDPFLSLLHSNQVHYNNNWGEVCFGGEVIGVLAIAEHTDAASMKQVTEIVGAARSNMDTLLQEFSPDGGFSEGPGYWNYASVYAVLYLSSLETALGTTFDHGTAKGFASTGSYRIQSIGPSFLTSNFGDCEEKSGVAPQMFWLARKFHRPDFLASELNLEQHVNAPSGGEDQRFKFLGLVWYALAPPSRSVILAPTDQVFAKVAQVYLRNSWSDRDSWYIGFKGGDVRANHSHLDLGSFVFDASGQRWAVDLGNDSYALPGYFGPQRWDYYRTRTDGHNTITVNDHSEDLDASATISRSQAGPDRKFAIMNLDKAYKKEITQWSRGIRLYDNGELLVTDEITPRASVNLTWHFHTKKNIALSLDGRTATLSEGLVSMTATILSPGMRFERLIPEVSPSEESVRGITDLVIRLRNVNSPESISVEFSSRKNGKPISVEKLQSW